MLAHRCTLLKRSECVCLRGQIDCHTHNIKYTTQYSQSTLAGDLCLQACFLRYQYNEVETTLKAPSPAYTASFLHQFDKKQMHTNTQTRQMTHPRVAQLKLQDSKRLSYFCFYPWQANLVCKSDRAQKCKVASPQQTHTTPLTDNSSSKVVFVMRVSLMTHASATCMLRRGY